MAIGWPAPTDKRISFCQNAICSRNQSAPTLHGVVMPPTQSGEVLSRHVYIRALARVHIGRLTGDPRVEVVVNYRWAESLNLRVKLLVASLKLDTQLSNPVNLEVRAVIDAFADASDWAKD